MSEIDLKTKAQQLFRDSKYEDAADLYGQALRLKGSNALILNSNLSACYFELGSFKCLTLQLWNNFLFFESIRKLSKKQTVCRDCQRFSY